MRHLSALLVAFFSLAPAGTLVARHSDPFVVAIVRDDGVILPVATSDRGRWRTPWPGPLKEADVPVRLEDCPLAWWGLPQAPREWTLHVPDEAPRRLTVDRVTWVQAYCQQQVVLRSGDAQRPMMRPAQGRRAPKYGVAVTGDLPVTLPREVDPDSTEARALLDAVQVAFNREERLMLARDYFATYQPSVDGATRDRMPVRALSIHEGAARAGGTTYYVELERRYPRRTPAELQWCDEVTYMTGWAHRGESNDVELSLIGIDVTSCLLDSVVRVAPHAILEASRGPVWLLEEYRPEGEAYSLYLAPDRRGAAFVARRFAGLCPNGR